MSEATKTIRFELQYAVVLLEDVNIVYNIIAITDKIHNITWFDTEDEAVFSFMDGFRDFSPLPDNMVVKRVVKAS